MGIAPNRGGRRLVWITFAAVLTATGLAVAGMRWWSAHSTLERGWSAYRESRWRDALSLANQRLKEDENDRGALRLSARASARLERDPTTVALYQQLGSEDAHAEDFFLLGETLLRQGQGADGERMWRRALRVDPAHAETLSELSRLLARTEHLAEAAGLAERLGELPGWEARGRRGSGSSGTSNRIWPPPSRHFNVPSALIRKCTSRTSRPCRFRSDWLVRCFGSIGPTRPKPFFGPLSNLGLTGRPNGCSVASHSNVATAPRPWPPGGCHEHRPDRVVRARSVRRVQTLRGMPRRSQRYSAVQPTRPNFLLRR